MGGNLDLVLSAVRSIELDLAPVLNSIQRVKLDLQDTLRTELPIMLMQQVRAGLDFRVGNSEASVVQAPALPLTHRAAPPVQMCAPTVIAQGKSPLWPSLRLQPVFHA